MSPQSQLGQMIRGFRISQAIYAAAKFGIADLLSVLVLWSLLAAKKISSPRRNFWRFVVGISPSSCLPPCSYLSSADISRQHREST
jgi:hypothetical protein